MQNPAWTQGLHPIPNSAQATSFSNWPAPSFDPILDQAKVGPATLGAHRESAERAQVKVETVDETLD